MTRKSQDYCAKLQLSNCELGLSTIENFLKKKACLFVFDCLKGNVCSPFKNYFYFLTHDFSTRNSGTTIALPKVKLDFARKSFYFLILYL